MPLVRRLKIVRLQLLDMMGFDFVERFPKTASVNKYIIIGIN